MYPHLLVGRGKEEEEGRSVSREGGTGDD